MNRDPERFEETGALLVEAAFDPAELAGLFDDEAKAAGRRLGAPPPSLLAWLRSSGGLGALASNLAGEEVRPVRLLLFDKTPDMNWALSWHQDRTLPLLERALLPGFERWTTKDGQPHVEPPEALSRRMITLRLHLDDAGMENGPLKVIHGSHRAGRLPVDAVDIHVSDNSSTAYPARAGDVLVLRTLILHASDRAAMPSRRRVLHVDFAPDDLPAGLDWAFDLPPGEDA